jgi:chemotaxis-related protein WspD
MKYINEASNIESCWNVIGIEGDQSCEQLSKYIHCRNCPNYSTSGLNLLERPIPEQYRQEWTDLLATLPTLDSSGNLLASPSLKVVIFRLQQEWLALPTEIFKEATPPTVIHTIPHRSNQILRGLVNIRGELLLCVSLSKLLHLEVVHHAVPALSPVVYSRLVVVEKADQKWVFAVDELYGVERFEQYELQPAPQSSTKSMCSYTKGLFHWQPASLKEQEFLSVSYLDDELLFTTLARKVY